MQEAVRCNLPSGESGASRGGLLSNPGVMARWALAAVAVVGVLVGASALLASSGEEPFLGNFEVGSPGWQQFTGLQYEVDRPVGDSFAIVGHPVRQGAASARLSVRHGYSRFGHGEDTSLVHHSGEKNGVSIR